jgi:hypothetical protein
MTAAGSRVASRSTRGQIAEKRRSSYWCTRAAGSRSCTSGSSAARSRFPAYLAARYAIDAKLDVHHRRDRRAPHLGRVELTTRYTDALARPLPSVIPDDAPAG